MIQPNCIGIALIIFIDEIDIYIYIFI